MNGVIQMAHGSGGKLSRQLLEEILIPAFNNPELQARHDGAQFQVSAGRMAFSTDSYVVKPRFFPGGNMGKLAVCGTVNDLAMNGAVPQYLSVAFIIEEGFLLAELRELVEAMASSARIAGVSLVTGDTKVVEKGAVDGIYINTAGLGYIPEGIRITAENIRAGQDVIVSGTLGDHSVAIIGQRYGLSLPDNIVSDCAPLNGLVQEMLAAVPQVAFLRDPTRGGVAAVLNEVAEQTGLGILLEQEQLPVRDEIQAVCSLLGFDPLYMANEGKLIAVVESEYTEKLLQIMHKNEYGQQARVIGKISDRPVGQVGVHTEIGGLRFLDMPTGEQLPRIC